MPLEVFPYFKYEQCYRLTVKGLEILYDDYSPVLSFATLFRIHFHIFLGRKSESWITDKRSIYHPGFFSQYNCNEIIMALLIIMAII
jgi:hypothetical protein